MSELLSEAKIAQSFHPAARTATANGGAVDATGHDNADVLLTVGAISGTSPTLDVKIQESATSGGTYTDITGAAFSQKTGTSNDQPFIGRIHSVDATKPFLRAVATIGGTTPSFTFAVTFLLYQTGLKRPMTSNEFNVSASL